MTPLLAISLWEPWASAMFLGLKKNETRGWFTGYRGDLVICAAKKKMDADAQETFDMLVKPHAPEGYKPQYGMALCVVELADCVPTCLFHGATPMKCSSQESALGNYEIGRFAWITRDLLRLEKPIPVIGHQQLFKLPPEQEAEVRRQLE